jgi:hypothetical protein
MQMAAQQQLIQERKEAAAAQQTATAASEDGKVKVMDIKVEDDFDIDDI